MIQAIVKNSARLSLSLGLAAVLSVPAAAVKVSPVINARLLGGQYFFENQDSDLSGNVGVTAAPAVTLNEQWTLIPTLSGSWRGTKSVKDLVGGGTLFQQTQDHAVNFKAVWSPLRAWQFKTSGGYRIQLLKETADEKWGKGLFDFEKESTNLEAERSLGEESSLRLGYDFYHINFRNYASLESQEKNLGRENAGSKTLNTDNHGFYLAYRTPFPFFGGQKARAEGSYFFTRRGFTDQKIVLLSGDLSGKGRRDSSHILSSSLELPFAFSENVKLLSTLGMTLNLLSSNQNNYDAGKTRFNSNYYAYKEVSVAPGFNLLLGQRPWILSAGFTYVRRNYSDRPVQDSGGAYGTDKIHANEYYANFGLTYPVTRNLRFQALNHLGWSRSNMKYEQTYRYNYRTFSYLLGVVYDY